ncbi:hypothetical protein HUK65_13340 [Rhodobacteraceae bacterium 2376]|uniref:ATP-dependent protease ClpP protease subunit n=1 Tax=Rhabdonatronobacter sediminivivens TaxID=2743469 RepID=A0A7Z0L1M5_9RHOB|nr:hypothetical protein [Rhabdonatronobacter sediminivivens]NYS25973.1 hypothetical protein [Rhabdonatronobacter sediminivivens]
MSGDLLAPDPGSLHSFAMGLPCVTGLRIDELVLRVLLGGALSGLMLVGVLLARTEPAAPPPPLQIPPPDFSLSLSADGRTLAFSGTVDFGLTEALRLRLAASPDVRRLTLDSNGGNIYEARGAVSVIRAHGLATHVAGHCASACALIFAGGQGRSMAPQARLGFHGYFIPAHRAYGMIDPVREMQRDMAIFRAQAVSEAFIARLSSLPRAPMWYPDHAELRAAGVLTVP